MSKAFTEVQVPFVSDTLIVDVDILIPQLRVVVEFDGSYWHRDLEARDTAKTSVLTKAGWRVIRVREEPLKPIGPDDVVVPLRKPKIAANKVLQKIEEVCNIPITGLAKYLERDSLVNEEMSNSVIAELLEARAIT